MGSMSMAGRSRRLLVTLASFFLPFTAWAPLVVGGTGFPMSLILLALGGAAALPRIALRRRLPRLTFPDVMFAIFMLAVGAAALEPLWLGDAETAMRALEGFTGFGLVAAVYLSVQLIDPLGQHVREAMKGFVLGNVVSTFYGVYQVICDFTGRSPIILLHNTPNYSLLAYAGERNLRAYGFSPEPSLMVGPLVVALVFTLTAFHPDFARRNWNRLTRWAAIVILVVGILLTFSQTLVLIPAVLVALMLAAPRNLRVKLGKVVSVASIVVLAAGWILYLTKFGPLFHVSRRLFDLIAGSPSNRARMSTIIAALRIFAQKPVLGVGPGVASDLVAEFGAERAGIIDSLAVRILADTGLIGFAGWTVFLLGVIVLPLRYCRNEPNSERRLLLVGVTLGTMVAFLWLSVTISAITLYYPWFWSAYAAALLRGQWLSRLAPKRTAEPAGAF